MAGAIEKVAPATLEQNLTDMQENSGIKTMLRDQSAQAGGVGTDALAGFRAEMDKLPTTEERVGQALTRVEGQFGQVGKQLARDFQSRGQTVSQASKRNLAIEKAKAKSGAAGAAEEGARQERLNTLERGVAVAGQAQVGATNQLTALQQSQQSGLETPQIAGVQETTGLEAAKLEGDLQTTQATQEFGTRQKSDDITHTQKGIEKGVVSSGATGQAPGVNTSPGDLARSDNGALITAGSAGATLQNTRGIAGGLMGSLKTAVSGVTNPR